MRPAGPPDVVRSHPVRVNLPVPHVPTAGRCTRPPLGCIGRCHEEATLPAHAARVTLSRLLRHVDGLPHVVVGPLLLVFTVPLARALGLDAVALMVFLVLLTAYGVVVLWGLRAERVPGWLAVIAVIANGLFLAAIVTSLAVSDLTSWGRGLHLLLLVNGAVVTVLLIRCARQEFSGPEG